MRWATQIHRATEEDLLLQSAFSPARPVLEHHPPAEIRAAVALERIADALQLIERQNRESRFPVGIGSGANRLKVAGRIASRGGDNGKGSDRLPTAGDRSVPPEALAKALSGETGRSPNLANGATATIEAKLAEIIDRLERQERLARTTDKPFYSVSEVAALTGYKEWTVRQACNKGRISGVKGDDGHWRIHRDQLASLREKGLPAESEEEPLAAE